MAAKLPAGVLGGGARHSDTVVVTRDGRETITDAPRGADSLTFGR